MMDGGGQYYPDQSYGKAEPPHNVAAEQALLGALLLNNEMMNSVLGIVEAADFYDPVHQRMFEIMRKRTALGMMIDAVTLQRFMRADPGLQELGGTQYFIQLRSTAVSIEAAPDYAQAIKDMHRRRIAIAAMEKATDALMVGDDLDEVFAAVTAELTEAEDGATGRPNAVTLGKAIEVALDYINDAYHGRAQPGVDLGIPELTEIMGHAQRGDMILLGGRPSMGKSAVALEMAIRAAQNGVGVVYWCGEMAGEDNAERAMSSAAAAIGVETPYHDARKGDMAENQYRALLEGARNIEHLPFMLIDPSITNIDRICHVISQHAKRFQKQGREALIVVDYLQKIRAPGRSRYEIVTEVSQRLKELGLALNCPILVLSQLSRECETRENKRPMLSDLRESGQIEQDANTIIFCYRDAYYLGRMADAAEDPIEKSQIIDRMYRVIDQLELKVAKQRRGPIATALVRFNAKTNRITPFNKMHHDRSAELQGGFDV